MAKKKTKLAKRLVANDKGPFSDKNAKKISKKTNLKIGKVFKMNAKQDRKDDKKAEAKNQFEAPEFKGLHPFDFRKKMAGKGEYKDMIGKIDDAYKKNPYLDNYKGPTESKKSAEQRTKDYKFNNEGAGSQLNRKGELVRDSEGKKFNKAEAPKFESGYVYDKLDNSFSDLRKKMGIADTKANDKLSKFSNKYKGSSLKIPNRGSSQLNSSGKGILKGMKV